MPTEYVKDQAGHVYVKHAGMEELIGKGELQACEAPEVAAEAPADVAPTTPTAPTAPAKPAKPTKSTASASSE